MGPQGLDGREYRIPQASSSRWWIMFFFLALLSLILTRLDIITQALHTNCHRVQTVMHHLSA